MPQPELRLILTTFAKEGDATTVIRSLLRENLAACGTLLHNARSIYRWEGDFVDAEEVVVLIKTTALSLEATSRRLKELHPYTCPEILEIPAGSLNPAYTAWVSENVDSHPAEP